MKQEKVKKILLIVVGLLLLIGIFYGVYYFTKPPLKEETFKEIYEKYNGQKDTSGVEFESLTIENDALISNMNKDEVSSLFKEGTGLLYIGNPTDHRSRKLVPILLDTANEVGMEIIDYYAATEVEDFLKDYVEEEDLPLLIFVEKGTIKEVLTYPSEDLEDSKLEEFKKHLLGQMQNIITCDDLC